MDRLQVDQPLIAGVIRLIWKIQTWESFFRGLREAVLRVQSARELAGHGLPGQAAGALGHRRSQGRKGPERNQREKCTAWINPAPLKL